MILKLYTSAESLDNGGVYVHQYSVNEVYPMHFHDFFEFFYVVSGKAIHSINGEKFLVQGGDLVFIRPEDVHGYEFFNNYDFELISINIPFGEMMTVFNLVGADTDSLFAPRLPSTVSLEGYNRTDIYRKLVQIGQTPMGDERKHYFCSILPYIVWLFLSSKKTENKIPRKLDNVITLMSERENFVAGLPRLVELAHTSQEHITREFRRYLGLSPTEFINTKRLEYAAHLLLKDEYDITEICFMCGFGNMSHFYRSFKKQYGCTPKQFVST